MFGVQRSEQHATEELMPMGRTDECMRPRRGLDEHGKEKLSRHDGT
jgi:hypothetical protein